MKEFVINKYLCLRLENGITNIYVNNKKILRCKAVLIDIPIGDLDYNELESIDEYVDEYKKAEAEARDWSQEIPPEEEFWGHCSNLHYWYLENYNSNLIHHELVFPLLKELTKAGDLAAKNIFKEEIARRYGSGYLPVMVYLEKEGYLSYLNEQEILLSVREALENSLRKLDHETVRMLIRRFGRKLEAQLGREEYLHILFNKNDADVIIELGKLIGKDIIIRRYEINEYYILQEEYTDPNRSPSTEFYVDVRDRTVIGLTLFECNINSFPEIILNLKSLTSLSLVDNNIKIIPKSILGLQNLSILNLAGNLIQDIPLWAKNLKCYISLKGNPLNEKSKELIEKLRN